MGALSYILSFGYYSSYIIISVTDLQLEHTLLFISLEYLKYCGNFSRIKLCFAPFLQRLSLLKETSVGLSKLSLEDHIWTVLKAIFTGIALYTSIA